MTVLYVGGYDSVKWKEVSCNAKVEVTTARHMSKVAQICHAYKQWSLYQGHILVQVVMFYQPISRVSNQ